MKKNHLPGAEARGEKLLCGAAAVLFPTAILCYFCAQNIGEFVEIWLIYFMLGVLVVLAALAYCVSLLILRRGFLAMMFCLICWTGCYLEPSLLNMGLDLREKGKLAILALRPCIALLIFAVAALAVFLLRRVRRDVRKPAILFSIFLALILVFNLLPIVWAGFSEGAGNQEGEQLYKTDFSVDSAKTDMPNVYWIHPDGMLGVDTIEKYYHEDQSEFLSALTTRGFSINASAHFEGGSQTTFCIPILTSPYAYDTWISNYTATHEMAIQAARSYKLVGKTEEVRYHNEMVAAFDEKGYTSNIISTNLSYYYPVSTDIHYDMMNNNDEVEICNGADLRKRVQLYTLSTNAEKISGFLKWIFEVTYKMMFVTPPSRWSEELMIFDFSTGGNQPFSAKMPEEQLNQIVPSSFVQKGITDRGSGVYGQKMIKSLYDVLHGGGQDPKLVVVHDFTPHGPYIFDENGVMRPDHELSGDFMDYYPQYVFSAKVLLGMIDMILEADPDAVIVIQADHGVPPAEEAIKAAFGEDADTVELSTSTMSAIRVPEKYQTGEERYTMENPLNLSRYLVNSFVGKNYEYLPPN